jgi:hypothetical protein
LQRLAFRIADRQYRMKNRQTERPTDDDEEFDAGGQPANLLVQWIHQSVSREPFR